MFTHFKKKDQTPTMREMIKGYKIQNVDTVEEWVNTLHLNL